MNRTDILHIGRAADDVRSFFRSNSRSFAFASLGFTAAERKLVQSVYAFCRITDDMVDECADADAEEVDLLLDRWLGVVSASYNGTASGIEWLDQLMHRSAQARVPFDIVELLVKGVRSDIEMSRVHSVEALREYCYRVASTVGVWLCYLFGVTDPWMLDRAASLGRAMQITNIVRDVGEDLERGRIYIPTEILEAHSLSRIDLTMAKATATLPRDYERVVEALIEMAVHDYEQAWEAIPLLPKSFARAAAIASNVYRGILDEVRKNGYDNLTHRARTSRTRKLLLMQRSLRRLRRARLSRRAAAKADRDIRRAANVGKPVSENLDQVASDQGAVA